MTRKLDGEYIDLGGGYGAYGWPLDPDGGPGGGDERAPPPVDPHRPNLYPPGSLSRKNDDDWGVLGRSVDPTLPCGVLSVDDRHEVPDPAYNRAPAGATGVLRSQVLGLGDVRGSAFLVRPTVAVTAAHNLYNDVTGDRAEWATFERAARCSLPETITHKSLWMYIITTWGGIETDIGVLCLHRLEAETHPPVISLADGPRRKTRVVALGHPLEFGDRFCDLGPYRAQTYGHGTKIGTTDAWHYHTAVTTKCQSGGPLLIRRDPETGRELPAIGVLNKCSMVIGGRVLNRAARLTPGLIEAIDLLADRCRER